MCERLWKAGHRNVWAIRTADLGRTPREATANSRMTPSDWTTGRCIDIHSLSGASWRSVCWTAKDCRDEDDGNLSSGPFSSREACVARITQPRNGTMAVKLQRGPN
jgi:hypothetical protein